MPQLKELIRFYEGEGREDLRLLPQGPQHLEFLTATRHLERHLPPRAKILDCCAGGGIYAFHLAQAGHTIFAGDIVPYNLKLLHAKQKASPLLADIFLSDARDLSRFPDASFQAVLCMGALYHLPKAADRELAMAESLRVLEPGGLIACTYMNRYAVALNNMAEDLANLDEIMGFLNTGQEGVFYAATPREMEDLARRAGLLHVAHAALDGPAIFLFKNKLLSAKGLRAFATYHFTVCEEPDLLGYSYHNLFLGRKA